MDHPGHTTICQLMAGTCLLLLLVATPAQAQITNPQPQDGDDHQGSGLTGTGSANHLAVWTSASNLSSSMVTQDGANVGVGVAAPRFALDVNGDINLSGALRFSGRVAFQVGPSGNVGFGLQAFPGNTGNMNTAGGFAALTANATGDSNSAYGGFALNGNMSGSFNTAAGFDALRGNDTGSDNTGVGAAALLTNTSGYNNTAVGVLAAADNTTGEANTAVGLRSLIHNSSGSDNTGIGLNTLGANVSGSRNTAVGFEAGANIVDGNYNIEIGDSGTVSDDHLTRIGTVGIQSKFFAAGIRGTTTGSNDAVPVMIDSRGQLGTVSSSIRFKEDVRDMGAVSDAILQLRPVTFRYREPFSDGSKPVQFGLIAEEVARVFPELVAYSANGEVESVKYQLLDPLLLNELQKQESEIKDLKEQLQELKKVVEKLGAQR